MKDFKKGASKSIWEADQRLKREIREGGFEYDDKKHTEWFIAMLLPHLHIPMSHQTFELQEKAVEVAMKLEVEPREDTSLGVQQIQEQLGAIHMEIQNLRKERGKGASRDLWCIRCRVSSHMKDQCPLLKD